MAKKEYVWLVRYGKTEYPLKENDGPYNSKYRVQVPGTSSPPGTWIPIWYLLVPATITTSSIVILVYYYYYFYIYIL